MWNALLVARLYIKMYLYLYAIFNVFSTIIIIDSSCWCWFVCHHLISNLVWGPSWSWSYGNWILNHLCNQFLSPLTLWVRILHRQGVLNTTLCYKVCQWLVTGRWFSTGTPVSSTNKTDRHDITEILLKVALNSIKQPTQTNRPHMPYMSWMGYSL
jgi:hypothetical protein